MAYRARVDRWRIALIGTVLLAAAPGRAMAAQDAAGPDATAAADAGFDLAALPVAAAPAPSATAERRYASFGARTGTVLWETGAIAAFLTAANLKKTLDHREGFHFQDEGWFGRDTDNLGVDKLAHGFNAYLFSEILYARMARKTGGGAPSALTAATLGFGLQAYGELFDGFKRTSGFSAQDMVFNLAGAGASFVRNSVPGLKDKLDLRIEIVPNHDIYSFTGKEHYRQERFLLALKLAGFAGPARGPLRFVELHAGYYATGFTERERDRGRTPHRRPFVGIGLNLQELFFPSPRSGLAKAARTTLEYVQPPYTSLNVR